MGMMHKPNDGGEGHGAVTEQRGDKVFNMPGGEQLRDYLAVTDVAKYIASLAVQRKDIGTVNICSGNPVFVRKLVEDWIGESSLTSALSLSRL